MSLNYDRLFKEMSQMPQVREATRAKAEQLRDQIEVRWPEVNKISKAERAKLRKDPEHTVLITSTKSKADGRPVEVVTVRHHGAVAKQAKSGFLTKAVKDVS